VSRRKLDNPNRGERQRDRGNNVNLRYMGRQTGRRSGGYNSRRQEYQDGQNFNGHAQGRVGEIDPKRLNSAAPCFSPRDDSPLAVQNTDSDWDRSDNGQDLNN
jgi:hypothetical protein